MLDTAFERHGLGSPPPAAYADAARALADAGQAVPLAELWKRVHRDRVPLSASAYHHFVRGFARYMRAPVAGCLVRAVAVRASGADCDAMPGGPLPRPLPLP